MTTDIKNTWLTPSHFECVQQVFGLTGGELEDKRQPYTVDGEERRFHYAYDGLPEWCESDYDDRNDAHVEYFTAVHDCLYGTPAQDIEIDGKHYWLMDQYVNSGETQCPCVDCDEDPFEGKECPLCERAAGEEHGYIYIGDGWCELVYRHDGVAHMRSIAQGINIQVWHGAEDGETGWFWQSCSPGCLPDAEMSGPFDSEIEALEDCTDGLE